MKPPVFVVMLLCVSAAAQTSAPKTKTEEALRVYEIALSEDTDYPSLPWRADDSRVQTECGGDGNIYVWKEGLGLVGLTRKGGIVSFLTDKITDIPKPSVSFTPNGAPITDSLVYLRVTGIDESKTETRIVKDQQGRDVKQKWATPESVLPYFARFEKDGAYKRGIKLDLPFVVYSFAAFDSGNFIAQGLDKTSNPRIALLDSSGRLARFLELPKDITVEPDMSGEDPQCRGCAEHVSTMSVAFSSLFTPWQGRVLLFRHFTSSPRVYEIQEGGAIRVVKIRPPEGYEMRGLIRTDADWLVIFLKPGPNAGTEFHFPPLFAMDPHDGKPLREYRVTSPDTYISCFFDGEFWGVRRDVKEGKLKVVRGTAQPYRGK